jgi:hypothetical protein
VILSSYWADTENTLDMWTYQDAAWSLSVAEAFDGSVTRIIADQNPLTGDIFLAVENFGSDAIEVWRYSGSSWTLHSTFSSVNIAEPEDLLVVDENTMYLVYSSYIDPDFGVSVCEFDGASWTIVGAENEITGTISQPRAAVDGSGTVFLTYQDQAVTPDEIVIESWSGANWVEEVRGINVGSSNGLDTVSNSSNGVWVIFNDNGLQGEAVVKRYDTVDVSTVGISTISDGAAITYRIGFSPDNVLHVLYTDEGSDDEAVLKNWNGSNWESVGENGFTYGDVAEALDYAFSSDGTPYVAYIAVGHSRYVTVMKRSSTE